MTTAEESGWQVSGASDEQVRIGVRLDDHHDTETNGRMAICRRCGVRTDGPDGPHAPLEQQLLRADQWLAAQALSVRIARAKSDRDT